jgi:glucose/arabinose dehydrogenase
VVEYRTNGTRASAPRLLFSSRDPYGNHNGGMLAFGPNGRLYFTMGDGGAAGDPENRAQNMRSLFGKLLSMNVATKGLKIEALGLRNAWRFSFDRANGDLYIGDVGQGASRRSTTCRRRAPDWRTSAGTSTRATPGSRTSRSARASS